MMNQTWETENQTIIAVWQLQYHTMKTKASSGWLLYKLENKQEWQLQAASSIAFPVQIPPAEYNDRIIQTGSKIIKNQESTTQEKD
ncbi:uncharacterized protein PITG_06549 [Phytophthora infestans T30-4]|uniref:Uncharacterized protein n=1 Tax=Phytophthora infestans (strain T30-4) TaxID=403677 RepID=D0N537_PHYIT|nr:uncharacterized protein PITG_06549 [Phytophthora infestans T30-4]EEY69995.1 hypothetical protein PITG_06549 [Phytophthora infestans T30-4]|eukprot:XP_002998642.1 hypothetical protein PITG_06549 [Phytophthora infestans T30-4]